MAKVPKNLFAYTATGSYPEYMSVNRQPDGDITVSVRGMPTESGGEGKLASITIPKEVWLAGWLGSK